MHGGDEKEFVNSIGMKFVHIPAGEFLMGSPESEEDREEGEQQHRVRITRAFYLGVHQVTQDQYQRVLGGNPSYFRGADLPVENVSWEAAVEFCRRLSEKEGKTYGLPTEAQWEYACRAGTTTAFHYGDSLSSTQANFDGNYPCGGAARGPNRERTTVVGSYAPNAWGLYDMHGNVWEWCQDYWRTYSQEAVEDPIGPAEGSERVHRGGSWHDIGKFCRAAYRDWALPTIQLDDLGFRVALIPDE